MEAIAVEVGLVDDGSRFFDAFCDAASLGVLACCRRQRSRGVIYSVGVNTTGARPISLISPIIRIIW